MPQSRVNFSSKGYYPGLVSRGLVTTHPEATRGYDARFYNDSDFLIPYGALVRYTGGREQGGLIGLSRDSWEEWLFGRSLAGIAASPQSINYSTDMYDGYAFARGYPPGAQMRVLQSGEIWLKTWKSFMIGERVTYHLKPNKVAHPNDLNSIGYFSSSISFNDELLEGSIWLTKPINGIALAQIALIEPIDPLVGGGFDPLDPFG